MHTAITRELNVMQPKAHLAFSTAGTGSVEAMFYVASNADIFGWYAQANDQNVWSAYYMIENYYANKSTVLHRSVEDDLCEQWITDFPRSNVEIRCPVAEQIRHELEQMQAQFLQEWLFFDTEPSAAAELAAYHSQQLPVLGMNIKSKKLNRLVKHGKVWTHSTPSLDLYVVDFLQSHFRINGKKRATP